MTHQPATIARRPMVAQAPAVRGSPWTFLVVMAVGLLGDPFLGWNALVTAVATGLQVAFLAYFARHLAFAIAGMRYARNDLTAPLLDTGYRPAVTVMVACKNEQSVAEGLVASLLRLDYPAALMQIVLVDDASTDRTGELLDAASSDQLQVVHRSPGSGGGKSGALNAGLEHVFGEVVIIFDADHQPHPDVVRRLVRHFEDPAVAAVQGRCIIRNPEDSLLTKLVALDYLGGYLVNEYGRQCLFGRPAYGGANCAVRTSDLRTAGGWNEGSVTEDTDLTLRLVLAGRRVRYDVTAVDEEEGVVTLERYWRQRYRWARGHQQAWRDYRWAVWRSARLSRLDKSETTMFLLGFHLPVVSSLGLVILLLWSAGLAHPTTPVNTLVLWTLLFLGPLLELGAGMLIARSDRRDALALVMFLPIFFVSIALCTRAWIEGLVGRRYSWFKTQRSTDPIRVASP